MAGEILEGAGWLTPWARAWSRLSAAGCKLPPEGKLTSWMGLMDAYAAVPTTPVPTTKRTRLDVMSQSRKRVQRVGMSEKRGIGNE